MPRDDRVRLGPVARPVHHAAGARDRRLQALELLGQRRHRARLDRRARRRAAPPSRAARRPPAARLARIVVVALPRLRRSWESAERARARRLGKPVIRVRRQDLGQVHRAHAGRAGARSAPPMCIRHELSADVQTSARVSSTWRSLSESIAIDVSAFLTANVPPKPQHSLRARQLDEVDAPHGAQQPQRPVADLQQPQRVAGRVVASPGAGTTRRRPRRRAGRRGTRSARTPDRATAGQCSRTMRDARRRRARRPPRSARTRARSAAPARRPRRRSRC